MVLIHLCDAIRLNIGQRNNSDAIIADDKGGIPQSLQQNIESTVEIAVDFMPTFGTFEFFRTT